MTPSHLTLVDTARRFGFNPRAMIDDPRIERLVLTKLDLDREIAKRRGNTQATEAELVRIVEEHALGAEDLKFGPIKSITQGIAGARRLLAVLKPAKLAPPTFKPIPPKETLCTNPKA